LTKIILKKSTEEAFPKGVVPSNHIIEFGVPAPQDFEVPLVPCKVIVFRDLGVVPWFTIIVYVITLLLNPEKTGKFSIVKVISAVGENTLTILDLSLKSKST